MHFMFYICHFWISTTYVYWYFRYFSGYRKYYVCIPIIATLIAKAITLSPIVGVTVIKCHEFSSGYKSSEQASTMPSLLQSRFLENWERKKNLSGLLEYTQTHTQLVGFEKKITLVISNRPRRNILYFKEIFEFGTRWPNVYSFKIS